MMSRWNAPRMLLAARSLGGGLVLASALLCCRGQAREEAPTPGLMPVAAPVAASAPASLPADFRACATDADCAVAPSLAGLDRLPLPGDTCRGTCFAGVRKDALPAWQKAVDALSATVPCDKEFEPCPPAEDFRVACVRGTCTVAYAPR